MAVKSTNELGESNDLKFLESFLTEKPEGYTFVTLQHRSPVNFGYPMLRPRFYVVGARSCQIPKDKILQELNRACAALAADVMPDFLTFLNLRTQILDGHACQFNIWVGPPKKTGKNVTCGGLFVSQPKWNLPDM